MDEDDHLAQAFTAADTAYTITKTDAETRVSQAARARTAAIIATYEDEASRRGNYGAVERTASRLVLKRSQVDHALAVTRRESKPGVTVDTESP